MARYRAIIRLFEIPVETRLGSEEVQRYSLFAQGSYLFSILRRLVLHFPAVSMAEYVFRRRTVYHFEEMEHVCRGIAEDTDSTHDFAEYDADGYYPNFAGHFDFPVIYLDRVGEDVN
ncbi:hypothetical protein B0H11DRAFT_2263547 [Mycena galericulata]|nr:hypothetical protein B0H11DRAFT_2263547 [Mycena galericulata]